MNFLQGLVPIADDLSAMVEATIDLSHALEPAMGAEHGLAEWAAKLEERALRAARKLNRCAAELGFPLPAELARWHEERRELTNILAGLDDGSFDIDWDEALVELTEEGSDDDE